MQQELLALAKKIAATKDVVCNEAETRNIYIEPFIKILGYDTTDPHTVRTEFTADIAGAKGEKVDYAIMKDGKPFIIIEAKHHGMDLNNGKNQLIRYFNVLLDAKFAILTNGIEYRFFTDLDVQNNMDKAPFFFINMESLKEREMKKLEKFAKNNLNTERILASASKEKYLTKITDLLKKDFTEKPSAKLIDYYTREVYEGRTITQKIKNKFEPYVIESISNFLSDYRTETINDLQKKVQEEINEKTAAESVSESDESSKIITTEEELLAHKIVQAILSEIAAPEDINYQDYQYHFAVIYKNKSRSVICKLRLDDANKTLEIPGEEAYIEIGSVQDLFQHKSILQKKYQELCG